MDRQLDTSMHRAAQAAPPASDKIARKFPMCVKDIGMVSFSTTCTAALKKRKCRFFLLTLVASSPIQRNVKKWKQTVNVCHWMWKYCQSLDHSISMTEMNLCLLMSIILSSMPFFPRPHGAHRAPTPPVAKLCRQHLQFQAECQESRPVPSWMSRV